MSLELALGSSTAVPVLRMRGRLDGSTAAVLAAWLDQHAPVPLVFDLAAVDYLSSAGLRVLVAHEKRQRAAGRSTTLAALRPSVRDVLAISGLATFWRIAQDLAEACGAEAPAGSGRPATNWDWRGIRFERREADGDPAPLVRLGGTDLPPMSLAELGLAVGTGGLGENRGEALAVPIRFGCTGSLLAMRLEDGTGDYLQAALPHAAFVHTGRAICMRGTPRFRLATSQPVALARFAEAAAETAGGDWCGILAQFLHAGRTRMVLGVLEPAAADPGWVELQWSGATAPVQVPEALLAAAAEAEDLEVTQPDCDVLADGVSAFLWTAKAPVDGQELRMRLESPEGLPEEAEIIARTLYHDCSAIRLQRLTGGYSAATYAVESHDREGRKTIPTVLKISSHAFTDREERAYHDFVRNFILNNSTVIMGRANRGASAGLRYNFLGITGSGSRLHSLEDVYLLRPVDDARRLYGQLATGILLPWYGQWREREISLHAEHDPRVLFRDLETVAADVLGIDPDEPRIACEPLGCTVANPWWYLRHEWARQAEVLTRCRVSITHGDLNLNNVLVDEKENLYVIDFSETRERNVAMDFARLEPLLSLQLPKLESAEDELRLLRWHHGMHGRPDLFATGDPGPSWGDPLLDRAHAMVGLLRGLARRFAGDAGSESAYLLPLLQWTLPVVCFVQTPLERKRLSTWVGGMIVDRLLRQTR